MSKAWAYGWLVVAMCAAVLCVDCATNDAPPAQGERTGTLGLAVQVAPGLTLSSVNYSIAGPNSFSRSGTIDVSGSATISAVIGGIPAGVGFTVTLAATSVDGLSHCTGFAPFNVIAHTTTAVTVTLDCHQAPASGGIGISGSTNVCPTLQSVSASPAAAPVGSNVAVSASAVDPDGDALSYSWTASSGTFADASAATTTFTCTATGVATLDVTVSDGDMSPGCPDSQTVQVTCNAIPDAGAVDATVETGPSTRSATIGPAGGTLATADGRFSLTIAAGALADDVAFTVSPAAGAPPGAIGVAYDLEPEGTTFAEPATITIAYDPVALGATSADQVTMATAVDGHWVAQSSLADPIAHVVAALTTHLSQWALLPSNLNLSSCSCIGPLQVAAQSCCTQPPAPDQPGVFLVQDGVCTCCGGPTLSDMATCVTMKTGGLTVPNFNNDSCLSQCCSQNGGRVPPNSDICLATFDAGSWVPVLQCAAKGCFDGGSLPQWVMCGLDGSVPMLECVASDAGPEGFDTGPSGSSSGSSSGGSSGSSSGSSGGGVLCGEDAGPDADFAVVGGFMCAQPEICCAGHCVDTSSDPANCNGCGNTCASGQTAECIPSTSGVGCGESIVPPGGACLITAVGSCSRGQCTYTKNYSLCPDGIGLGTCNATFTGCVDSCDGVNCPPPPPVCHPYAAGETCGGAAVPLGGGCLITYSTGSCYGDRQCRYPTTESMCTGGCSGDFSACL